MTWVALKFWWEHWFGLLLFGLVWVICFVTVIFGPPATFGFFHAVRWMMVEKETRWDQYYRMARKHFLTSWLWFLANGIVFTLVYINYFFYGGIVGSIGQSLKILSIIIGIIWFAMQFYTLPYFVLQEKKSLPIAWKNSLFTILASPPFSLVLWVVLFILFYLHLAVMPFLFGGPGLVVLLSSMAVEDRIQKFGIRERESSQAVSEEPASDKQA